MPKAKTFYGNKENNDVILERLKTFIVFGKKEIELSNWDMDSTATYTLTLGTSAGTKKIPDGTQILGYSLIITDDNGKNYINPKEIELTIDGDSLVLTRLAGGTFDSALFDGTGTRGFLFLELFI